MFRFIFALCFLISSKLLALAWTTPVDLAITNSVGESVQVIVDGSGNAIAVWMAPNEPTNPTSWTVYTSMSAHASSTWSTPAAISEPLVGNPSLPVAAAMNSAGQAVVAWSSPGRGIIRAATATFGSTFSTPVDISAAGMAISFYSPAVAINASGYTVITWATPGGTFQSSTFSFANPPSPSSPLSIGSSSSVFLTSVGIDSSGNARALWTQGTDVYSARLTFGSGAWTVPQLIVSNIGLVPLPSSFAVDASGNALFGFISSTNTLGLITFTSGGSWSSVQTVSATSARPSVVIDSLGNGIAIWGFYNSPTTFELQSVTIPIGGSPHTPQLIASFTAPDTNTQLQYDLAIDTNNTAYALFGQTINTDDNFQSVGVSRLPSGTSWTTPKTISLPKQEVTPSNGTFFPITVAIGACMQDFAAAAWLSIVNASDVAVQVSKGILPVPPPDNLQGNQVLHRFPVQSDLINQLSWTITGHQIDLYKIYRNSLSNLIGTTTSSSYQDHDRLIGVSTTYYVTAFSDGSESAPSTVTIP